VNNKLIAELEYARTRAARANKRLAALTAKVDKLVKAPELAKLLGKTFVYPRNSYSSPQKESDYWPVYVRVVGVKDGEEIRVVIFETDSNGTFSYRTAVWDGLMVGYFPCDEAEYRKAFKKQMSKVLP
jgi:hypothetical protein